LERLILEEYKSIKPRHKKMMVGLIIQNDISPTDALETLVRNEQIVGEVASQVEEFCEFCNALSSGESTNIAKQLSEHLKIDIHIIFEKLEIFFQENNDFNQEEKIKRFCDELIPESALPPESPNAILFLTMHGSKGLTKNTVVMPGLEKAWLPGNDDKYGLEEKMRQFYVSITRATDHVLITYPRHRARGDPLNFNIPGQGEISPFVRMSNISCKFQD
jgi:superfamily I DNA/RNA helicase